MPVLNSGLSNPGKADIIPGMKSVSKFQTDDGRTAYCFPVRSFPGLISNIYVIDDGNQLILVDCASGIGSANDELAAGFAALSEAYNLSISLSDVGSILITHGHIDHFGGLPFVRQHTDAPVGIHLLDRRVISNHAERLLFSSRRLESFLASAGVSERYQQNLMNMYLFSKNLYSSMPVQFLLEEGTLAPGGLAVYHVPGHCPGQVCLKMGDLLFTADHVLSRTTPHQAPESITNNMGLGHYLDSLTKIQNVAGVRLALGGHEDPIEDLPGRVDEIKQAHLERLEKILGICQTPKSIADISRELFGKVESYHVLLALEETGAHVEYLYQRGELAAANLDEIERTSRPVVRYAAT